MTHDQKLKRIEELTDAPDVIEFYALVREVEEFERTEYPMEMPSIAGAMRFRREQMLENQKQISMRAGMSLNRWKQLESGKIQPSMADARKLYAIGIPESVLLQP